MSFLWRATSNAFLDAWRGTGQGNEEVGGSGGAEGRLGGAEGRTLELLPHDFGLLGAVHPMFRFKGFAQGLQAHLSVGITRCKDAYSVV